MPQSSTPNVPVKNSGAGFWDNLQNTPSTPLTPSLGSSYKPFTGNGYFPSTDFGNKLTDVSGRPFQGYTMKIPASAISPMVSVPSIDETRVAAGFDPTQPMPLQLPKSVLENSRMSEALSSAIKKAMNGNGTDELDHIVALGLSGSNDISNLQIQPGIRGGVAAASDKLENSLISKVKSGEMTLYDAQNELAQSKGKTLPENAGQRSAVDQWLMDNPDVLYPLANLQNTMTGIPKNIWGNLGNTWKDTISSFTNAYEELKTSAVNTVSAFTSKGRPTSEKIGTTANLLGASANVVFSPISAVFNALKDVPLVGSVSQIATLPFAIVGTGGEIAGKEIVNALPISAQDKNNLRDAVGQLGALAAQIALGYGIERVTAAGVIRDTATETADRIAKGEDMTPQKTQDILKANIDKAKSETPATTIKPNAPETPATSAKLNTEPIKTSPAITSGGFANIGEGIESVKQNIQSVADYVKERSAQQALGSDISDNYYRSITNGKKIDDIMSSRLLDQANISPEDQKAIYNWMENPKEAITPEQKAAYNSYIKPLVEGSTKIYNYLKNKNIPIPEEDSPEHATRVVRGRGSFLDRLQKGFTSTRMGSLLSKSAGFLKKRTMMALEDEGGDRIIVSIKDGTVTGWNNGEGFDMGKLKTDDYQSLADKEMKPFQDKLDKLQKEKDILSATKGRAAASPVRLENINKQITELANKIGEIENKYNTNLNGKVFVDSNGKAWKITDATTKEIEANTNVRYYKTPLVSELQKFNKLNQIQRATDFLESTRGALEDQGMIKKIGSYDIPDDWKTSNLPQFRGYLMPKRIANVLDSFYKQYQGGDIGALTKMNLFLRITIFFNPLIHVPNILVHWVVNRGGEWASPLGYVRMVNAGVRAIRAVLAMNDDYVKALNEGAPLLFSETKNADLYKAYLAKASYEMSSDPKMIDVLKNAFGLDNPMVQRVLDVMNPYKISGKVTWAVNDIATLQAIFEEMDRGKSWSDAITDVGKHIPNYRLPPDLLGSKQLMDVIKNPNITMFSAYHYGALRSYFEMVKSLVAGKDMAERTDALGKIVMLGIVTYVIYPELDKLIKQVTGNKNAYVRRAGASTFPYNTEKFIEGKESFTTWITSVFTPSVLASLPLDVSQGYLKLPTATEFQANPVGSAGSTALNLTTNLISPASYASNLVTGKKSVMDTFLQFAGISTPASTASQRGVYDLIYNQRPTILKQAKSLIASGDTDGALRLIETYNQDLKNMFIGILTDRGYSQSDAMSIFNQWLNSGDTRVSSYFIKNISQKSMQSYNAKLSRTSLQNLILK
ncbi:hypothetical protein M1295_01505 [Patescibacteria group bacterium]|nr:hypothetical protein [Patescibacteria group bacterium]